MTIPKASELISNPDATIDGPAGLWRLHPKPRTYLGACIHAEVNEANQLILSLDETKICVPQDAWSALLVYVSTATIPKASEPVMDPDATVNLPLTLNELHAVRSLLAMSCRMLGPTRTQRDEAGFAAYAKADNLLREIWRAVPQTFVADAPPEA